MRYPFFNTSVINSTSLEFQVPVLDDVLNVLKNSIEFEIVDPASPPVSILKNISAEKG